MVDGHLCSSERVDVLGVPVSAINLDDATATIERWIDERSPHYICVAGVHGIMESRRDRRLKGIFDKADMVTPDGMPLVWFARLLGRRRTERVYGPDLMRRMTAISHQRRYRQFYYGGADGVAEKLREVLTSEYPGLQCEGAICPPFRELSKEEDDAVVAAINAAKPDILWVGLSTPKQELWMAAHLGAINVPVMIGVGAAFDFLAGTKRQAPRWIRTSGFEWLFRLCSEPRRLWRRYAYIVPGFIFLVARHFVSQVLRVNAQASRPL